MDELDAQDVSDLPKVLDKLYDAIVDVKGSRAELLQAMHDIARFRDGIAHPAFISVSVEDARNLSERISTAARIIFGAQTKEYQRVNTASRALFDFRPPALRPLTKSLPPRQEVVGHFIGRERELRVLFDWLASPVQLWVLEGDGGKGKSSLAYVFSDSLESAGDKVEYVIWLSAKNKKFQEGSVRALTPDFSDLPTALKAIATAYGFGDAVAADTEGLEQLVIELLQTWPALIVLDDLDSLEKENENVAYWFTNTMARQAPNCKLLITTRREPFGLGAFTTRVVGLNYDETKRFLRAASEKAFSDPDKLGSGQTPKFVHKATEGSPLYLEDIVRLILISGKPPHEVISEWNNVRHDVREYALRREFEMLSKHSKEVLLAAALAEAPITRAELLSTLGGADSALESAIAELQRFFLISAPDVAALTPTFEINRNLGVLVKVVMKNDPSFKKIANALKQVTNKSDKPHKVARDAQHAIRDAVALVTRDQHAEAEALLRQFLQKYPDEGSLLSHLGWVLTRWPDGRRQVEAQTFLQRAVDLRHRHKKTYENLGTLYLDSGMYERAESALEVGVSLFRDDVELYMMYVRAKALVALELANRVDVASASGVSIVLNPLRDALRAIMDLRKQISDRGEFAAYSRRFEQLTALDMELRSTIDGLPRLA